MDHTNPTPPTSLGAPAVPPALPVHPEPPLLTAGAAGVRALPLGEKPAQRHTVWAMLAPTLGIFAIVGVAAAVYLGAGGGGANLRASLVDGAGAKVVQWQLLTDPVSLLLALGFSSGFLAFSLRRRKVFRRRGPEGAP